LKLEVNPYTESLFHLTHAIGYFVPVLQLSASLAPCCVVTCIAFNIYVFNKAPEMVSFGLQTFIASNKHGADCVLKFCWWNWCYILGVWKVTVLFIL